MSTRQAAPPELLSPAGDMESLRAAVANGADAVYFGLTKFNARARAANFAAAELPQIIDHLHDRQRRGYVTFNTLLFDDELPEAAALIEAIARSGADALIVQDLGALRLARRIAPTLPLHASTQMTLTDAGGIEMLRAEGIRRVILPRELTLDQIRLIRAGTSAELEVFVHGALCVSYSGQCLASLALGGRSANRGECAQPCRLPYRLVSGTSSSGGAARHLLSPKDLCALPLIPELCAAGIAAFKIEGRLKSPHYVACATRAYRDAIDRALSGRACAPETGQMAELTQVFSRGAGTGYLAGVDHAALVDGGSPNHRGILIGCVERKSGRRAVVSLQQGLPQQSAPKPGDGIVVREEGGRETGGGRIYSTRAVPPGRMELEFDGDAAIAGVQAGQSVWKTDDPVLEKRLAQTWSQPRFDRPMPLHAVVTAAEGKALRMALSDDAGHSVEVASDQPLERARSRSATAELLREQLGRLGGTPFALATLEYKCHGELMIPKSLLNDLRRRGVEQLLALRHAGSRHAVAERSALEIQLREFSPPKERQGPPRLHLLARTMEQVEATLATGHEVCLDLASPTEMEAAAGMARALGQPFHCATLRIYKPGELSRLDRLLELRPSGVLVRNVAALAHLRGMSPGTPLVADFPLNVSNTLALAQLAAWGVRRVTPSCDLDAARLMALARRAGAFLEVPLYRHLPMFHMEHCPREAFLHCEGDRKGSCRAGRLRLRDRLNVEHDVTADSACRTTVWHGEAAKADELIGEFLDAGVRDFRIEFLNETAAEIRRTITHYERLVQIDRFGRQESSARCR